MGNDPFDTSGASVQMDALKPLMIRLRDANPAGVHAGGVDSRRGGGAGGSSDGGSGNGSHGGGGGGLGLLPDAAGDAGGAVQVESSLLVA